MINFNNDYTELVHPRLLNKISEINMSYDKPYGFDSCADEAQELIRAKINCENVDVHFISGGTQTNLVAIASALLPFHSVISTEIAHINSHETGALEATGHKIYSIPHVNGKLDLEATKQFYYSTLNNEQMAVPKLICITNATEYGTYYTKAELSEIYEFCKENDLYLFIDGARMSFALTAENNDVDFADLPNLCDMFYFGGTKNGALLGEALVLVNDKLKLNYKAAIKQRGAMLAKGRVMSAQFCEFFHDGLYEDLGRHANSLGVFLKNTLKEKGYKIFLECDTNQIFAILSNEVIEKLQNKYIFAIFEKVVNKSSLVRFVTSWATTENDILELKKDLEKF